MTREGKERMAPRTTAHNSVLIRYVYMSDNEQNSDNAAKAELLELHNCRMVWSFCSSVVRLLCRR